MKRTYILIFGLIALMTACTKTENMVNTALGKSSKAKLDYDEQRKQDSNRFAQEIAQPGDCWAYESNQESKASFLKAVVLRSKAYILMAKDKGLVLFGQPQPDCQESFAQSAKCVYWIRVESAAEMSIFFNDQSKKVACPAGVSIKALVDKASSSDVETIDFTKVGQK